MERQGYIHRWNGISLVGCKRPCWNIRGSDGMEDPVTTEEVQGKWKGHHL